MPTQSESATFSELLDQLTTARNHAIESGLPVMVSCQGIPAGKLFVLNGFNSSPKSPFPWTEIKLSPFRIIQKKHPNRPMKPRKNSYERGDFNHLKKGQPYKVAGLKNRLMGSAEWCNLYKTSDNESSIGKVFDRSIVIYLETVQGNYYIYHKVLAGDQVGFVRVCSTNSYLSSQILFRLKRITSRMLRRLDAFQEATNSTQECNDTIEDCE